MNRVIHFEIHAQNPAKIAEFYTNIFGWEIKKWNDMEMDYWMIMTAPKDSKEPGIDGGITKRMGPMPKMGDSMNSFVCTISVPNVDKYLKKIEEAGGKTIEAKMPIKGMAWLAYASDIEGNIFGLFQEDKKAK